MAVRKVVKIDEELCDGCGECVPSCAEGAIQIIGGKARLLADNLCDGLGACLGDCPQGAITVEEREADEFDEDAVEKHLSKMPPNLDTPVADSPPACSCPGSRVMNFQDAPGGSPVGGGTIQTDQPSALRQWPIQLHLVPPTAPYFQGANVLLAADCTAFAVADFHAKHLAGRALAIACPKLDQGQDSYLEKLVSMIDDANIDTLTVMVMEVPCCAGLFSLAVKAVELAKRKIPVKRLVVGIRGDIIGEEWL